MIWSMAWHEIIIYLPIVVFSLTVHEFAHGYAALLCGDPTAKYQGRLTLNPLRHLDPFGMLAMLIAPIGWAKPVPVNTRNLKNRRYGISLVSLAGPLSNLLVSFVALLIYIKIVFRIAPDSEVLYFFFTLMAIANLGLAVFNLLPIPPLDGSKIFLTLLPYKMQETIWRYEQYGFIVLLFVIFQLSPYISEAVYFLLDKLILFIDFLPF